MSTRETEKSEKRKKELLDEEEPNEQMEAESSSGEEESSEESMDEEMEQLETEFEAYPPLPCDKEGKKGDQLFDFYKLTRVNQKLNPNHPSSSRNHRAAQAALQEGASRARSPHRASDQREESVHGREADGWRSGGRR